MDLMDHSMGSLWIHSRSWCTIVFCLCMHACICKQRACILCACVWTWAILAPIMARPK